MITLLTFSIFPPSFFPFPWTILFCFFGNFRLSKKDLRFVMKNIIKTFFDPVKDIYLIVCVKLLVYYSLKLNSYLLIWVVKLQLLKIWKVDASNRICCHHLFVLSSYCITHRLNSFIFYQICKTQRDKMSIFISPGSVLGQIRFWGQMNMDHVKWILESSTLKLAFIPASIIPSPYLKLLEGRGKPMKPSRSWWRKQIHKWFVVHSKQMFQTPYC